MSKRKFITLINKINFKFIIKIIASISIVLSIFFLGGMYLLKQSVENTYSNDIYSNYKDIPKTRVAIVFGAGLYDNFTKPSAMLEDRVLTAVDLYKAGKIDKILVSGDNRTLEYNEPKVMLETALKNGVKEFDIQPDFAGRRTYDTCYRAKTIFGINKAVLVTQEFHLYRAMYICSSLGIEVIGIKADRHVYADIFEDTNREYFATLLAFIDLNVFPPEVVKGEKIIF